MAKPLDYYAGYPSQQRMPKWVGVTLGSLFGGLMVVALALAIRLVMPARAAEASMAPKAAPAEPMAVAAPAMEPTIGKDEPRQRTVEQSSARSHSRHHGHASKAVAKAQKAKPAKGDPRYKKAQMYAKSVSSSSRRDKRARDDLDKLLGM